MRLGINLGVGFLAYMLLRLAGVPFEAFLALLVAVVIGWPLGWFIGSLIGEETDVDTGRFKAIGWANLIAWLVPIAGIAVASLTSSVAKESIRSRLFYDAMSFVGYLLVAVSVPLYVHLLKSQPAQMDTPEVAAAPPFSDHKASSERSFARCPYALVERWTEEEIETNCNHEPSPEEIRAFEAEQQRVLAGEG